MGFFDTLKKVNPLTWAADAVGDVIDNVKAKPIATKSAEELKKGTLTKEQLQAIQARAAQNAKQSGQQLLQRAEGQQAPQVSAAQIQKVGQPTAATIQADQTGRNQQLSYLDMLQKQATGQAPSVAQQQYQQNLEQALTAQVAGANTAGTALAQRQAQVQGSQMQQQAAREGAILAGQERERAMQAGLQGAAQLAGQDLSLAQAQAQLQQQAGLAGFEANVTREGQQAQLSQQAAIQNAQLEAARQARIMEIATRLQQQGVDQEQAFQQAQLSVRGQDLGVAQSAEANRIAAATGAAQTNQQMLGGLLSAGGALGAAALSDKNAKENIEDGDKSVQNFLDALKAYKFDYKAGEKAGEEDVTGVMAQDLEKSEAGKNMVKTHEDGLKRIDVVESLSPILGSLAQINQRLKELEKSKA